MATLDEVFTGWGNLIALVFNSFLNPILWILLFVVIFIVSFAILGLLIKKAFN